MGYLVDKVENTNPTRAAAHHRSYLAGYKQPLTAAVLSDDNN